MADKTSIGWVNRQLSDGSVISGHTFNPWWGCMKVSEECQYCYAEGISHHFIKDPLWGPAGTTRRRFFGEKHWSEPHKWNRQALKDGHRHSVFCASMADIYEDHPLLDPEREKLWKLIAATPMLNWLLLTKRPQNILDMSPWGGLWLDNVWVGTSVGLQKRAEERIPHLLEVPAHVRFVSCEPLLESVDLSKWLWGLDWVIAGGESGHGARPMNMDWARSLRDQCQEAHVPYFFKQVGGRYHESGGRDLDGWIWDQMPPERSV